MTHQLRTIALAIATLSASIAIPAAAEVVRLHGATTVVDVVVTPHRAAVQKSTGHTLEIVGNATGKGLVDLSEGHADAALVSEPMEIALDAAAAAGKKLDASKLQMHEVKKAEIVFVVHPSNSVSSLTWDQLRDIHTGKITNWKEVGGKDMPIVVYSDAVSGGTRAMVKKVVMGGAEYGPNVRSLTAVKRVAELVAKDPAGVGGVGAGFVAASEQKVIQTKKIERPLALVTMGPPSAPVKDVIAAFRAEAK